MQFFYLQDNQNIKKIEKIFATKIFVLLCKNIQGGDNDNNGGCFWKIGLRDWVMFNYRNLFLK